MHRIRITLSIALCALAAFFVIATFTPLAGGASKGATGKQTAAKAVAADPDAIGSEDPDLPPGMAGKIDKADYLRRRAEYIDMKRGRPYDLPYDPREKAIQQMDQQEAASRQQLQSRGITVSSPSWVPIGPAPIPNGQTSDVSTPVSGRTISIAVHPTNPDIVYVGAAQGGLKKSTDGGATWAQLFDFTLESNAIGAITIDPVDPNTVYIGTGENGLSADCFGGKGMYIIHGAEGGSPTIAGPFRMNGAAADVLSSRAIGRIVVNPADTNTLYLVTTAGFAANPAGRPPTNPPRGLYRSTNAQAATPTFEKVLVTVPTGTEDRDMIDLTIDPTDANVMLVSVIGASADGGIYRTANALAATPTFVRTRVLPDAATQGRAEFSSHRVVSPAGLTVYAAVAQVPSVALGAPANCSSGRAGYVIKSTDGGVTWSSPLPGSTGFCGGQCSYDIAVAATDDDSVILLGGNARGGTVAGCLSDVMKRSLNSAAFVRSDVGLHADEHALAFAPSNQSIVYTSSDGGIWRSTDAGANWTSRNTATYSATQFQALYLHPFDRNFMLGGTQDNGTNCLSPDGVTWLNCRGGDGGYTLIDQNAKDTTNVTMYHTFFNQPGIQILFERADDIGFAWVFRGCAGAGPSNNGIGCTDTTLFYAPMDLGPGNPNTVYFATDKLYRSADRGDTMPAVSQVVDPGQPITSVAISRQDDNVRLVGTRTGRLFATTTGAPTLTEVTGANFPAANPVETVPTRKNIGRVLIDPNNKNTAYATFAMYFGAATTLDKHIFKTTDLNNATPTWTPSSNGIPDVPVDSLAIDPQDSNSIYAGTDIGVYHSSDGGANWTPFNNGLPRVAVFDAKINNVQRVMRIATHGRGIWEIDIPGQKLPVVQGNTTTVNGESCSPANNAVDPGETVTVNQAVKNIGAGPTTNLVVTLLASGGVTSPSGPQTYGVLAPNAVDSRNFTFTASGSCGGTITLTFHAQDGPLDLGNFSVTLTLGTFVTGSPAFSENFDSVTPPALPPGWATANTGTGGTPWTTTTAFFDTPPNSAATGGSASPSESLLTSPVIAIPNAPGSGTNARVLMRFRNNWNTEGGFDGEVLEISIAGGAYQDIIDAGGSFESNGYNSTIGNTDSPLAGRAAWSGTSNGFVTTTVKLPTSSYGQNVQFRWRYDSDTGTNPAGGGVRIDTVSVFTGTQICCVSAPSPVTAVSRRNHAGTDYDIDLLSGSRIECRAPGVNNSYQVVVTFPAPVTVSGVVVTSKDNLATGTAMAVGSTVTVDLMNVTDVQTLTITLKNVMSGSDVRDVPLSMTVLGGDTNEDTRVNIGDVNQTKGRSGQTTSMTNFRSDVNEDGRINIGDVNFVKDHSGNSVASRPQTKR